MALILSTKELVIIIISIMTIILGILLLTNVVEIKQIITAIPIPSSDLKTLVFVFPSSSQQGTVFQITANYPEIREQQDLSIELKNNEFRKTIMLYDDGNHFDEKARDGIYSGHFASKDEPIGDYEITFPAREEIPKSSNNQILATFSVYKPNCEVIQGVTSEDTINFVILPYQYLNYDEFKAEAQRIITGKDSLLKIEPFQTNKEQFTFSIINTSRDLQCDNNCKGSSTIVCCDNKIVKEEASQCHHDGIIILLNNREKCGSASTYSKICAKQPDSKLSLVHELGHSFAGLADEYVYENYYIGKVDAPNCADKNTCQQWSHITPECIPGCTYQELYRSSKDSIMRSFVPYFNLVSEVYIDKLIKEYQIQESTSENEAKNSYFINLKYKEGDIEIKEIALKPIKSSIEILSSDYTAEIKDKSGKTITKTNIRLPITIEPLPGSSDTPITQEEFEYPVFLSFSPQAEKLEIKEKGQTIDEVYLQTFSRTCGNNICDSSENNLNCPSDCTIENDNFCQSKICDPDCPQQTLCKITKTISKPNFAIILIIISLLIITIVFLRRKK